MVGRAGPLNEASRQAEFGTQQTVSKDELNAKPNKNRPEYEALHDRLRAKARGLLSGSL
jgi:hypothetical protein